MMANPIIDAFLADQAPGRSINADIHPQDEMFLFDLPMMKGDADRCAIHYLAQGKRICGDLKQIVDWYFGGFSRVGALLDFASGYGRLTRWLLSEMPASRIWVSDIYAEAVAHQQAAFGVHGIVSTHKPQDYPAAGPFDCIYVGSLFSHLPERTFTDWLSKLYSMLAPGGLIAFSVLDLSLLPPERPRPSSGYFFAAHSESRSLDTAEYGTTYVSEDFVRAKVEKVAGGGPRFLRIPRGLANHQDLYLIARGKAAGGELNFTHGPEGFIEICRVEADGRLFLRGWAADLNPAGGVREIAITIDGRPVATLTPDRIRKDVVNYFKNPAALNSGWSTYLDATLAPADALLMAKVVNKQGMSHVFSVERVGKLIERTAMNK